MVSARWGDLLNEEEEELPPSSTTGPDAKGVVTKVEYYRNDKGEVMKKTTKTRVVKIEKKVYKVRWPRATLHAALFGGGWVAAAAPVTGQQWRLAALQPACAHSWPSN